MKKIITILATLAFANIGPAAAQQNGSPQAVFEACEVLSIAAMGNRIHIQCRHGPNDGPIRYFAVENTDGNSAQALAVLSVANAAIDDANDGCTDHNGTRWACDTHLLIVTYRTNPTENPVGCLSSDCRRIVGVALIRRGTRYRQ